MGTLVYLADRLMLARYSRDALASMQVQGPLMWSLSSVLLGLALGVVPLVARGVGAGDHARTRAVARAACRLSVVLGSLLAVLTIVFVEDIVAAFGPSDAVIQSMSRSYLLIAMSAMPLRFFAQCAAMILQAAGNTRTPLVAGTFGNGANVALNWLLISGTDLQWSGPGSIEPMGVRGAAIGTAAAFLVEAVWLGLYLRRKGHPVSTRGWFRARGWPRRDLEALRRLFGLGMPALAERVLIHLGFLGFARIINELGPLPMATNQAMLTIESICFLGADGFGVAASALVGQRLGGRDPRGARVAGFTTTVTAAAAIGVVGLVIWATARWTLPVFTPSTSETADLVELGMATMPWLAVAAPLMAGSIVLSHALRGAGDTRTPVVIAVVGGLPARLGLAWFLGIELEWGLFGVWAASTCDWFLRTALLCATFLRGRWARLEL